MDFICGKKEPQFVTNALTMGGLFASNLPSVPRLIDNSVPGPVPMYCNDRLPSCTIAAIANSIRVWTHINWGRAIDIPDDYIESYLAKLGGSTSGLVEADVLKAWRRDGFTIKDCQYEDVLLGFIPLNLGDLYELAVALDTFKVIYTGFNLPASTVDQFNSNAPVIKVMDASLQGRSRPGSLGGHAMCFVKRDADKQTYGGYTWGQYKEFNDLFVATYIDEAWGLVSSTMFNSANQGKFNLDYLKQRMALLSKA